jgi:hypothetical protein
MEEEFSRVIRPSNSRCNAAHFMRGSERLAHIT